MTELGMGGMGTVHLAEVAEPAAGLEPGRKVAVKVVHPHLLASPGFFKRFLQEAEIGRQVRHPNVVRTFDADAIERDERVIHYLVMEHVAGKSLRQLLRELGTVPETILREIALQVAAGLAAIHERSIVHRDLKPENILITDDHVVRIMDLGVAKLLEATQTITRAGQFAGSLLYGAPEQFTDKPVGPAADLYALGVVLYELATGEHPFRRANEAAVIEAHLHHTPPPPAEENADLTSFFSELVTKLMAKNAHDRFASAETLRRVLEESERSAWWVAREPELRQVEEALPKIRVRRETDLLGREGVLDTLQRAWTDAKQGRGAIVLVEGETGIGKTRVLDTFMRSLEREEMHVLYGSYPPSGGLGGISDALLGKFGRTRLSEALAPYLTVTPSLVPAFAALVTEDRPPPGADALSWSAFMTVCVHLMQALAEEKPLLWLVDDLHFAPKESRDVILALARAVEGRRALLVATARPGLPDDELAHLGRLENFVRVPLRRLGAREVVELLRHALHSDSLASKLGGTIAYKSDGVPFFIFEMIRGLEQGRFIKQLPDGSYEQSQVIEEIEVPSAVKDLIQGRLRELGQAQREILDVGSVQGLSFDPGLVAQVLERKKVHVLQDIAQIERQTGVVHGAAGAVEFDQHQVQEVLYVALIPDLRKEYHALVAEAFAERLDEPSEADAVFLASHHLRGSAPERGLPYLTGALDHLAQSYRNEALIELAKRALELHDRLGRREQVDVLLRKASRLGMLGRREQERDALEQAATVADETGHAVSRAEARIALARHLIDISQYVEAIGVSESALELANEAGDREVVSRAQGELGRALLSLGRYAESRPHFERRLELAREGDLPGEAAARRDLGLLEKSVGRYAEARAHFARQLEIAHEIGDRQTEAGATGNLGTVCKAVGSFEEARALFERHRELAREVGDRLSEGNATGNLGLVLKNLGRLEEARALFEQNLEISREIGNRLGEATATGNLGLIEKSLGHYEEARAYFERSRDLAGEIGDRQGAAISTGNLGNVLFDLGHYEEALEIYAEWHETAREMGDRRLEVVALGNLGNALDALGRYQHAHDHFEQARRTAGEIGDREGEGIALSDLGVLLARLGDPDRGSKLLEQSRAIFQKLGARRSEGYALHGLGTVAAQMGDSGEAALRLQEALDLHREIHYAAGEAETELALGRLQADLGRLEEAQRHLADAATHARALDIPSVFVPAACRMAALTASAGPEAEGSLAEHETRLGLAARMDARFWLWTATRDRAHLKQAHTLLTELRTGAPAACRDSMIESVPLHRDIMREWEERGGDTE
ncbi:MAG: serine/threonine-protein kinase [Planctomycetota bacterium]